MSVKPERVHYEVTVRGTIERNLRESSGLGKEVAIDFWIDSETGNWHQWGQSNAVLGQNVTLMEALRDTVMDARFEA